MASQVEGMNSSRGWPLGLRNMNLRLRLMEAYHMGPSDSNSFRLRSASFSSLSSSDLDTESTRSFFQDGNVTLDRLIGARQGGGDADFTNSIRYQESFRNSVVGGSQERSSDGALCHGLLCIPLIMSIFAKTSPSREDHSEDRNLKFRL